MRLRGYSHDTTSDGSVVVKRYRGALAAQRRATEVAALSRLAGLLPVPAVLGSPDGELRTVHVAGVHGQELIENGHATAVLRSCGRILRQVQAIDVRLLFPDAAAGSVLVHGDFGPNNLLLDPVTFAVTAIVDWEWAHAGDPVEDLAWAEWIVRRHHGEDVPALRELFQGYGREPAFSARHASQLAKCREIRDWPGNDPAVVAHWERNIAITSGWTPVPLRG